MSTVSYLSVSSATVTFAMLVQSVVEAVVAVSGGGGVAVVNIVILVSVIVHSHPRHSTRACGVNECNKERSRCDWAHGRYIYMGMERKRGTAREGTRAREDQKGSKRERGTH